MPHSRYRFAEFELDPATRELWRGGQRQALPLKSLECLSYLIAHRERAVGRDELISAVWGRADVSDTVVAQTMRRARKALDDAGDRQAFVRTVSGFGYRWVAPVEVIAVPRAANDPPATDGPALPAPAQNPGEAPVTAAAAPRTRRGRWILAAGVGALLAGTMGFWWYERPSTPAVVSQRPISADTVTVLPVEVEPDTQELSWMRLGAMEYAAGRLRAGRLKVTPTDQTLHLDARLGDRSSDAAVRALLASSGSRWALAPTAQREGKRWRVRLRVIDRSGVVSVEAQGESPLGAMAVATDAWLRRVGRRPPALEAPGLITERLQRVDAELDAGQLEAAREQILGAPPAQRDDPRMQVREGQLEYRAGRLPQARALFEQALQHTGQTPAVRAKALMGLGGVSLRAGRPDAAEICYTQALAALEEAGPDLADPSASGNAYNGRGASRAQRGDMDGAVRDLGLARVVMQESGDLVSAAMVGSNIGRMEARRGHWQEALAEFDRSLAVFDQYDIDDYAAATLAAKSGVQLTLAQPAQALVTAQESDALHAALEDPALKRLLAQTRARALFANGRLAEAASTLHASAGVPEGAPGEGPATLDVLLALANGNRSRATDLAAQALRAAGPDADPELSLAAAQAGIDTPALRAWLTRPHAEQAAALDAALATAILEARRGNRAAALKAATAATALTHQGSSPDDSIRAGVLRARLLAAAGQREAAISILGELDPYAERDYRVAWLGWTLHRSGSSEALAARARRASEQLRGERRLEVEPVL